MATILITGATGGIGRALAQIYHERGERLVLVGRRDPADLDADFFAPGRYCRADLTQPDAADTVRAFIDTQSIPNIDLLIHNAGVGSFGDIPDQPPDEIEMLTAVNFRAPVALTHALLPYLAGGKIVFISSVVSSLPAPEYAVYAATKAALDGFAYNLRIELADEIAVQLIHPGATRTDMHKKAGIPPERMDTSKFPPPEVVAPQIVSAIESDKPQVAIGTANKLMRWAGRNAAKLVDTVMMRGQ